ncbi:tail fiber assembly protein [Candidatus Schmidhempelia bombi]|uniref:Tail fiber assembly protein n=1 Tax=Candidatus Schmidhempelia bombi str. Bimp TaxID=1387197 RepID=A0AB94IAK4_9GAMM|nr:tail fiber assembly protein [Candidatus Schmidhempelia bombi]TEA26413.1 tail fiber assembly protein [Candidatus Schmidhempelia bombi str. Bimp]
MKYQLQPEIAIFDDNGLATMAGWAVIYNVDFKGEYSGATYQFLPVGVGVPANSYLNAPNSVKDGKAIVRVGDEWTYPSDYRGKKIYSTETGAESTVTEIGDIPTDYTLLKPSSEFDRWDGEKWVLDEEKRRQHYVNLAAEQKQQLLSQVNTKIDHLQDAIDIDIATDEEKASYTALKKYRVLLNRVDINTAPEIKWPKEPVTSF